MTPIEAAGALEGTQAPYGQIAPILLEAVPLLREGGAVPADFSDEKTVSDRAAVIDTFKKIDPQKWQEILKPDRQAIAKRIKLFQPVEGIAEILIKSGNKSKTRKRKDDERWVFYDRNILFNPESLEIMEISKQEKGLGLKLRGKRLGSIIDPDILPAKIRVFTVANAPYHFSDNPHFKRLAHNARYFLNAHHDDNLVLYYGGEQWRVADFCVTGALILCNANAPEKSGFPEDYRIIGPDDLLEPYYFAPFVPASLTRSTLRPARYLTQETGTMERLLKQGRPHSSVFIKGSEAKPMTESIPAKAREDEMNQCFSKGEKIFIISASQLIPDDGLHYTTPTPQMIVDILKTVPDDLLAGLKRIRILDKTDPNHYAANAGYGTITFFKRSEEAMSRFEMGLLTRDTFYHELGHHIAWYRFGDSHLANHCGWLKAMQGDASSPSEYAQKNRAEDFAETAHLYFATNGGFSDDSRERHPNRFAFLDELFWDVLTPTARKKIRQWKNRLALPKS